MNNEYNNEYNNHNINNNYDPNQQDYNMYYQAINTNQQINNNSVKLIMLTMISAIIIVVTVMIILGVNDDSTSNTNETKYSDEDKINMVTNIKLFISKTVTAAHNNEFGPLSDSDYIYYIPVSNISDNSCISFAKGNSYLGEWKKAYVAISYAPERLSYDYYFTFLTEAGFGMPLTNSDDIKRDGSQFTKDSGIDEKNITTQLNERAKKIKVFLAPSETTGDACTASTAIEK